MRLRRFPCSLGWETPPDDPCPSKLRSISPFKEPLLFLASGQTLKLATTALPPSPPTPPEVLSAFALLEKSPQKVRAGSGHTTPSGTADFSSSLGVLRVYPGKIRGDNCFHFAEVWGIGQLAWAGGGGAGGHEHLSVPLFIQFHTYIHVPISASDEWGWGQWGNNCNTSHLSPRPLKRQGNRDKPEMTEGKERREGLSVLTYMPVTNSGSPESYFFHQANNL